MTRLVLSDLDGTLITSRRELTNPVRRAVGRLREAGIGFALVSGRPPLGMRFIVRDLEVRAPFAAFNGAMIVGADQRVLEERHLDSRLSARVIQKLDGMGLDTWVYRGQEWLIRDATAPHVARERDTVRFNPVVVRSFDPLPEGVLKIVGVSDDYARVERAERELRDEVCSAVMAARSQNYYLDVTHPDANKGTVVQRLAELLHISPAEIATLGDMPSDLAMFRRSGISFAMGNASDNVKSKATYVVASNDEDGFVEATDRLLELLRPAHGRKLASPKS